MRRKFPEGFSSEVMAYYNQHGMAETLKKFPNIDKTNIYVWRRNEAVKIKPKKEKIPKEPTYKQIDITPPPKPAAAKKKVLVLYSEDTDQLIATLKGIL